MGNNKGVYAGVALRCEVESQLETSVFGSRVRFPNGYAFEVLVAERLAWLPNEPDHRKGVLFFKSNKYRLGVGADPECDHHATVITPELIAQQASDFWNLHAGDITEIEKHCLKCEVVWAVVPWYEF